jgi:phosphoesterase RecJ-like protein
MREEIRAKIHDWATALRTEIDACERIWITVHESPDGDSIGSALALYGVMRGLGKNVVAIRQLPFPSLYERLHSAPAMVDVSQIDTLFRPQMIVACDIGSFRRIGKVLDAITPEVVVVNVDHHPGNDGPGRPCRLLNLCEPTVASTTMLAYLLLSDAYPGCIGPEEARCLYLGLVTDTGCFRHSNTDAAALQVAADLARLGADSGTLAEEFMFRRRPEALRLLAAVLGSLELHAGGRFATLALTQEALRRSGGSLEETEGFVNYATSLHGVYAAALFREMDAGTTRVSLRSTGRLDVARLAAEFGGGGHRNAAGLTVAADLTTAQARVGQAALRHLDEAAASDAGTGRGGVALPTDRAGRRP